MSAESKLIHKLLICFELIPEKPVSDENFQVKFVLKNIGESVFPGGQLDEVVVNIAGKNQTKSKDVLMKIPQIEVNKTVELEPLTFFALEDGAGWISLKLESVDKVEPHLFQNPSYDMGKEWGMVFQIRKREYELIISLLQKIVALLEEDRQK
jgi:hypothetical protein